MNLTTVTQQEIQREHDRALLAAWNDAWGPFQYVKETGETTEPPADPFAANIWTHENRISSDGAVRGTRLQGLPEGAQELIGRWAKVDGGKKGETKLGGVFAYQPFDDPKSTVTNVRFDQVQLYNSLTGLALALHSAGFDINDIIGKSKNGRIVAHANKVDDMNAWYSPQSQEQTYGTSRGKWHLASDDDVTRHESGHFTLDQLHPGLSGWYSGEGGAIHEGFADAMAAFLHDDPEVSEDFPPAVGKPESKTSGLRTVANDLTLKDVSREVHDRGKVYGGFLWSIKEWIGGRIERELRLAGGGIDPRTVRAEAQGQAAQQALRILVNHGTFYSTNAPKPVDFVRAVLAGAEALYREQKPPMAFVPGTRIARAISWPTLHDAIIAEAIRRKLIEKPEDLQEKGAAIVRGSFDLREILNGQVARDKRIHFAARPVHVSRGIGGLREFYQEYLETPDGRIAKVVGAGLFVYRDRTGRIVAYADSDVQRPRLPDGSDRLMLLRPSRSAQDALDAVRRTVERDYQRAAMQLQQVRQRMPFRMDWDQLQELKNAEMRFRIAATAREHVDRTQPEQAELAVIPSERDVFFEFKMGLSLYYVNARTGAVMAKDDVLWS